MAPPPDLAAASATFRQWLSSIAHRRACAILFAQSKAVGVSAVDRKLAAILAADVVGYSALMEQDEQGTFERLRAGRKELFEPEIARHHGQIFKLMGDGLLAEFSSVVDAVECAVALQKGLAERNAAVPEDQRFQVRIGINLGEEEASGRRGKLDPAWIAERHLSNVGGVMEHEAELVVGGARKAGLAACVTAAELKQHPNLIRVNL